MLRSASIFAFLSFSLLYFTSYSSGPTAQARDVTGSPLTTQQCAGCHNGGNFDPVTTITLIDQGESVTVYEPGKTYTLQVSIAAENSPAGYGYQAVVLDANNDNAGTFGPTSADFRIATSGTRNYLEHVRRQSQPLVEVEWTAPAAGTGEINVYAAANAVNFSSSTSGDNADTDVLTLTEMGASSAGEQLTQPEFSAFQSSAGEINLALGNEFKFPVQYSIHNLSGKVLNAGTTEAANFSIALENGTSQFVFVVVRDADGQGGSKRVVLR